MANRARQVAEEQIAAYVRTTPNPRPHYNVLPRYTLDLSYLGLSELPELPDNVDRLILTNNRLRTISHLPAGLDFLECGNNQLTHLPELPPRLTILYCYSNPLVELPPFPPTMRVLNCQATHIVELPRLPPRMEKIFADNSSLRTIPLLGPSITHLTLEGCPLVEPYASLYRTFRQAGSTWTALYNLKRELQKIHTEKAKGRNVMGLMLARPEANAAQPATTEALGVENIVGRIGSFLSGTKGPLERQLLQVHEKATRVPGAPGIGQGTAANRGAPAGPIPNNNNVPALVAEGGRRRKRRKTRKTKKTRKVSKSRK